MAIGNPYTMRQQDHRRLAGRHAEFNALIAAFGE